MDELIKIVQAWIDRKEADGCRGCAFEDVEEWHDPCRMCKRACKDYWRAKGETP